MKKTIIIISIITLIIALGLFIRGCSSCEIKGEYCCKGSNCETSVVSCIQGTEPVFHGCDNKCLTNWTCEPIVENPE